MIEEIDVDGVTMWKGNYNFPNKGKVILKLLSIQKELEFANVTEESGKAFSTVHYDKFRPHKSIYFSEFYKYLFGTVKHIHYGILNKNFVRPHKLTPVFKSGFSAFEYFQSAQEFTNSNLDESIFNNKFLIDDSWCNLHYRTGETNLHEHGTATYVCSFYVNVPENSGNLLVKPKDTLIPVEVSTGDLIIFPGSLLHKTERSNSDEERVVATTNIFAVDP